MILHIGCGDAPKQEGTLNVDIRPLPNIDVVADALHLPFTDGEHDGIITRNLVEHFGRHEIDDVFKEWARVVKKDATLVIETVDMGLVMDNWRKMETEAWMDGMLGAQTYPENFHKMAFTKDLILTKLHRAGFDTLSFKNEVERGIPRMKLIAQKA